MPRLFTGLEIPENVMNELSLLRGGLRGARWIEPENYHITLRFIGDIDDAAARDAEDILAEVRRNGFELRIDGLSSFGGRRPRALVALLGSSPAMMELQAEHERLMRRVGLEPEGRKAKYLYTIPTFQNPAGVSTSIIGSSHSMPREPVRTTPSSP